MKNEHCSEGFNIHLWVFEEVDEKTFIFQTKPRHVTPQIELSQKNDHCSDVFQHTFLVFSRT